MTRFTPSLQRLSAALLLLACGATAGASLRINQIADQAPDLAVFVSGLPKNTPPGGPPVAASAALADQPLRVKSLAAWDPAAAVSVVVAVDVSASMARDFDTVKRAVGGLVGRLPAGSQVALLPIGAEAPQVQAFGTAPRLLAALDGLQADAPETALYEAIVAAQQAAGTAGSARPLRRLVLVITDALDDNRRGFGGDETLQKISVGEAPVLALALAPPAPPAPQRRAIQTLARISRASGGALLQSSPARMAQNLDLLLAEGLRSHLLLLDCSRCPRDGVVRSLQVSVPSATGGSPVDSRAVRLMAPAPAAPVASAPGPAASAAGPLWAGRPPGLWLALGALLLTIAGLLAWWFQRRRRAAAAAAALAAESARIEAAAKAAADADAMRRAAVAGAPDDGTRQGGPGPAAARDGSPLTLDIDGQGRMEVRVGSQDVVIGRSSDADVCLEHDAEASSRHAALYRNNGALMLRDLGASNGTWLNGTRIVKPEPLSDRDVVRVGRTELRVYFKAVRRSVRA